MAIITLFVVDKQFQSCMEQKQYTEKMHSTFYTYIG